HAPGQEEPGRAPAPGAVARDRPRRGGPGRGRGAGAGAAGRRLKPADGLRADTAAPTATIPVHAHPPAAAPGSRRSPPLPAADPAAGPLRRLGAAARERPDRRQVATAARAVPAPGRGDGRIRKGLRRPAQARLPGLVRQRRGSSALGVTAAPSRSEKGYQVSEILANVRLLRALRRLRVDRSLVWLLRHARRYLPAFRATRAAA